MGSPQQSPSCQCNARARDWYRDVLCKRTYETLLTDQRFSAADNGPLSRLVSFWESHSSQSASNDIRQIANLLQHTTTDVWRAAEYLDVGSR